MTAEELLQRIRDRAFAGIKIHESIGMKSKGLTKAKHSSLMGVNMSFLGLANTETKPLSKWIPVIERLPEIPNGKSFTTVIVSYVDFISIEQCYADGFEDKSILAWQLLPQPYKP